MGQFNATKGNHKIPPTGMHGFGFSELGIPGYIDATGLFWPFIIQDGSNDNSAKSVVADLGVGPESSLPSLSGLTAGSIYVTNNTFKVYTVHDAISWDVADLTLFAFVTDIKTGSPILYQYNGTVLLNFTENAFNFADFPTPGVPNKIIFAKDLKQFYYWNGAVYVQALSDFPVGSFTNEFTSGTGWDADTNTPEIVGGTGTEGDWTFVSTAGSTSIDGINSWGVGDYIWWDETNSVWKKVDNQSTIATANRAEFVVNNDTEFEQAYTVINNNYQGGVIRLGSEISLTKNHLFSHENIIIECDYNRLYFGGFTITVLGSSCYYNNGFFDGYTSGGASSATQRFIFNPNAVISTQYNFYNCRFHRFVELGSQIVFDASHASTDFALHLILDKCFFSGNTIVNANVVYIDVKAGSSSNVADVKILHNVSDNVTTQTKLFGFSGVVPTAGARYIYDGSTTPSNVITVSIYNILSSSISGTVNYIPKFTSVNSIGDSRVSDDGTDITITSGALKIDTLIVGKFNESESFFAGGANYAASVMGMNSFVTALGKGAFNAGALVANTTAIGADALKSIEGGSYCTMVGSGAGYAIRNGLGNSGLGEGVLSKVVNGGYNTALGMRAGYNLVAGSRNIFIGANAGYYETDSDKLYIASLSITDQVDLATAKIKALVYGEQSPTTTNQLFRVNGNLQILSGKLSVGVAVGRTLLDVRNSGEEAFTFEGAQIMASHSTTTNDTSFGAIALPVATTANYGYSIRSQRLTLASGSAFYINFHNNSDVGVMRLSISGSGGLGIGVITNTSKFAVLGLPTSSAGLSADDVFTQTATQLGGSGTTKVLCIV